MKISLKKEEHLSWTPGDIFINQQGKCLQLGLSRLGKFSLVGSAKVQLGAGAHRVVPAQTQALLLQTCLGNGRCKLGGIRMGKNPMNNE